MSPTQALLRAAERAIREADRLLADFTDEIGSVMRAAERVIRQGVAGVGGGRAVDVGARATALRRMFRAALRDAGFDALADAAYGERVHPLVQRLLAARRAGGLPGTLTAALDLRLQALGALYRQDLLDEGDVAARLLWRTATRGLFSGMTGEDLVEELVPVLDRSRAQIVTLYDTSVSILGRQVEAIQAGDEPETRFAFVGPVDVKTRPWCLRHVGKVFTRAEIDQLDNGQIGPVFLTGGGYNCRHLFMEISKASELYPLAGTDERIPEVQDDLDALREAA